MAEQEVKNPFIFAQLCALEIGDNAMFDKLWTELPELQRDMFELFDITTAFGPCRPTSLVVYYSTQTNNTPNEDIIKWLEGWLIGKFGMIGYIVTEL